MWLWAVLLLGPVLGVQDDSLLPLPLSVPAEVPATTHEVDVDADSQCFAVARSACPQLGETCRCKRIDNESAVCCDINSSFQLKEGLGCEAVNNLSLAQLHIWNATLNDLDNLSKRNLTSLTVSHSRLDRIGLTGHLKCLNVSGNVIRELPPDAFLPLADLEFLSLAHLNLTKLPKLKLNTTLDLSGNDNMTCLVLQTYLKENSNLTFHNENITFCQTPKKIGWFNVTEQLPLPTVRLLNTIEDDCMQGCQCTNTLLDFLPGNGPRFAVHVSCIGMGLQALPEKLPSYTTSLNVSDNNITSLNPLAFDKSYQYVRIVFADSNQISSIIGLEGSSFIDNFVILSLKNNHIKSLPTYILSNTFDRNDNKLHTVNLGLNRFTCNCSVAQVLRIWLLGNKKHIPDYDQILCDNMPESVVELDVNTVCVYVRDWTDYIYYIIAGEVGLLLLLVGKVSYDYWVFKTAGYLPWPASKMPKLPCDWVFE